MRCKENIVDLPELAKRLQEQNARCKDLLAKASVCDIVVDGKQPFFKVNGRAYRIEDQTHGQIAGKMGIPKSYYDKMYGEAPGLLADNVNHWLHLSPKTHLVRLMDDGVRAFLSDKYRPINHLDLVTVAMQVMCGLDGKAGDAKPYARGARCLSWDLTPTHMNVRFVNPAIWVDLEKLDEGVHIDGDLSEEEVNKRIMRRGLAVDRTDWSNSTVYPSGLLDNSETGHGGLNIEPGLMEGLCINFNWYGKSLEQRHLGRTLEMDDMFSTETYKKMNAVVFAKSADIFRSVFDPQQFLITCKRFAGLKEVEIDVKDAVDNIVELPGMTEGLRDDIMTTYLLYKSHGKRKHDNLFDLNRAVTEVAQKVGPEQSLALEQLGGELILAGESAKILR